jgi:hypothetical protein
MPQIRIHERTENNRNIMDNEAKRFLNRFMEEDNERVLDYPTYRILYELEARTFWGVLQRIDKNPQVREKTLKTFKPHELEELLSICVNQAITFPRATNCPGSLNGHSIIYEYFVDQNSLVNQHTREIPDFERILQNGRFWESLANMRDRGTVTRAWGVCEDVLVNHFSSLTTNFIPEGLAIIAREDALFGMPDVLTAPKLYLLDAKAIPAYLNFFLQVYENLDKLPGITLTQKRFRDKFFRPYVERVLERDEDRIPLFPAYKTPSATTLLANPPCQEILSENPELLKAYRSVLKEGQ